MNECCFACSSRKCLETLQTYVSNASRICDTARSFCNSFLVPATTMTQIQQPQKQTTSSQKIPKLTTEQIKDQFYGVRIPQGFGTWHVREFRVVHGSLLRFRIDNGSLCESRSLIPCLKRIVLEDNPPIPSLPSHLPPLVSLVLVFSQPPDEHLVVCRLQLLSIISSLVSNANHYIEVILRSELTSGDFHSICTDLPEKLLRRLCSKVFPDEETSLTLNSLKSYLNEKTDTAESWGEISALTTRILSEYCQKLRSVIEVVLLTTIQPGCLLSLSQHFEPKRSSKREILASIQIIHAVISSLKNDVERQREQLSERFLWWCVETSLVTGLKEVLLETELILFDLSSTKNSQTNDFIDSIRRAFAKNCLELGGNRISPGNRGQLAIAASDPTESLRAYSIAKRVKSIGIDSDQILRTTLVYSERHQQQQPKPDTMRIFVIDGFIELLNDSENECTMICSNRLIKTTSTVTNEGKWYFEAILYSEGSIKIGYCSAVSSEQQWCIDISNTMNDNSSKWKRGDVIRCEFDPVSLKITFNLNGSSTSALSHFIDPSNVCPETGIRPFVSLSPSQSLAINFGAANFL